MADNTTLLQPKRKERDTNIELLRVLCMLGIVAHHAVVHGGGLALPWGGKALFASLVVPAGKIGFTCFLAISMWFLCDGKFKGKRFIATWLEVLFYTVLMTAVAALYGADVSIGQWIGSFLPIGGISHGFAATYLVVYLMLPLLVKLAEGMTKTQVIWTILLLAYCQIIESVFGVFGITIPALHPFASEILLFVMFFFILLLIKRWPLGISANKIVMASIVVFVWAICTFSVAIPIALPNSSLVQVAKVLNAINPGENGVFNIIGGIALFFLFKQLRVPHSKAVNRIASCTFGVLLFHDHNVCRSVFWNLIIPFGGMGAIWQMPGLYAVGGVLIVTLGIFFVGCLIDLVRQKVHSKISNCNAVQHVCEKFDSVWNLEHMDIGGCR